MGRRWGRIVAQGAFATPHVFRHIRATWRMQEGDELSKAVGFRRQKFQQSMTER